jgi:hypothetical protein
LLGSLAGAFPVAVSAHAPAPIAAHPIGSAPIAGWPSLADLRAPSVKEESLVDDATCLVEIDVFEGGGTTILKPQPIAYGPIASFPYGSVIPVGDTTLKYSDTNWLGEPTDPDRPNAVYLGRAVTPIQFERDAPILPEQQSRLQAQFGQIVIAAGDGVLDSAIKNFAVAGRSVRVYRGPRSTPTTANFSSFSQILSALATGWTQDENQVTIDLRDTGFRLDQPLQSNLYAGTGGAEGDSQWLGKPKPCLFGFRRNITPDLIDTGNLVYRVHFRAMQEVTAVRDLGAALTFSDDYDTYADLIAASLSGGDYATCLADGLLRIETSATQLTVDAKGDNTGGYVDTHAGIARRVLSDMAALNPSDYIASSFGGWPGGTAGLFYSSSDAPTCADALDRLSASIAGWWGPQRDGRIVGGALFDPSAFGADLFLALEDFITLSDIRGSVQLLTLPTVGSGTALPRYRQRVGYQQIETVQSGSDLAGTVSASDRAYYSQESRSVTAIDTTVQTRYPLAADYPVLISLFDASANAQTLADTVLGLHKHERRMFRVPSGGRGFLVDLGKVVNLAYPRYGIENGQNFVVVGTIEDANDCELILWG